MFELFKYDRTTVDKKVMKRLIIGCIMFFGTLLVTVYNADPIYYNTGALTIPLLATFLISVVILSSALNIKILFELGKTDETLMKLGTHLGLFGMTVAWFISLVNVIFFQIWLFEGTYYGPAKMFFILLDLNILIFPVGILMSLWVGANHGAVIRDLKLSENGDEEAQMRVAQAIGSTPNNILIEIMAEIGNLLSKK